MNGWRDVIKKARSGLGAAGGVGVPGAHNAQLELSIGGPLLDHIEDALEELESRASAELPEEPTEAMLRAALDADIGTLDTPLRELYRLIYMAMRAAAPACVPPQAGPNPDPVAELCAHVKESIRLCGHGYIHITCGDCNHVGNR